MFNALGDYIKSVNSQSLIANMTLAYLTKIRLSSIEEKKYIKESLRLVRNLISMDLILPHK